MRRDKLKQRKLEMSDLIAEKLGVASELVTVIKLVDNRFINIEVNTIDIEEEQVMSLDLGFEEMDFCYSEALWEEHKNPHFAERKKAKPVVAKPEHTMAKLTIWRIECLNDSPCYSIVKKTMRAALAEYDDITNKLDFAEVIEKVEINYKDAFDLFTQTTGEWGDAHWGRVVKKICIKKTPMYEVIDVSPEAMKKLNNHES